MQILRPTVSSKMAGVLQKTLWSVSRQQQQRMAAVCAQRRWRMTNTEGTGPPRVLITGGLGQLGSGLAKVLR